MKITRVLAMLFCALALAWTAAADTLVLKNGDRLTGTLESSDGKTITFKADKVGEVKVQWSDVQELNTEKPLFVTAKQQNEANGTVTVEDSNVMVHTATGGTVTVPVADVTVIRSPAEQEAYEKSLHPGILQDWVGGASFGFALARGNSDTTNLAVGGNGDRKTKSDELKLYLSTIYSKATGVVTANEILGGARFDRNLTPKLFAFVSADFLHDELQSLDIQQIYSGGLGWHLINHPTRTLDVLAGLNYTRDSYSGPTAAGPNTSVNQSFPALTLGEDFAEKMGKTSALTEDFTFYPDLSDTSQYRFAADAGWTTQIMKWFGWQIQFGDRYISNPPILGTKKNDLVLSTGVKVSFGGK
jgi:putative salt-induced outer membrane protein